MSESKADIHELAGGQVVVWIDPGPSGGICLKLENKFNDPVELADHHALELANLLIRLVKEQQE
jgi:hypothetical protein